MSKFYQFYLFRIKFFSSKRIDKMLERQKSLPKPEIVSFDQHFNSLFKAPSDTPKVINQKRKKFRTRTRVEANMNFMHLKVILFNI